MHIPCAEVKLNIAINEYCERNFKEKSLFLDKIEISSSDNSLSGLESLWIQ